MKSLNLSMMRTCKNCGNLNSEESNFCRFCGTRSHQQPPIERYDQPFATQALGDARPESKPNPPADPYNFSPPPPYSWKTDEFRTNNQARQTLNLPPQAYAEMPPSAPAPLANFHGGQMVGNYRCINCGTTFLPRIERKISTAGWVTFALLLVFIFPLFWIGLLIKEDHYVCPMCRRRVA